MPQWLWILIGILVVVALIIFIMIHVDVTTKGAMFLLPLWWSKNPFKQEQISS